MEPGSGGGFRHTFGISSCSSPGPFVIVLKVALLIDGKKKTTRKVSFCERRRSERLRETKCILFSLQHIPAFQNINLTMSTALIKSFTCSPEHVTDLKDNKPFTVTHS